MSIQKKSLISTLKTAKKANVATGTPSEAVAGSQSVSSKRFIQPRAVVNTKKVVEPKTFVTPKKLVQPRAVINTKKVVQPRAVVNTKKFVQPS